MAQIHFFLRRFPKSIERIRTSNFYFNMTQIHFYLRRFPKSIERIRASNFYFNGTNPFLERVRYEVCSKPMPRTVTRINWWLFLWMMCNQFSFIYGQFLFRCGQILSNIYMRPSVLSFICGGLSTYPLNERTRNIVMSWNI